ncbi:MAG: hypothetical protein KA871_01640 [Cloacibacterium sp.]|nr:hypothetical protein [Cloacibacterium sp.]
MDSKLFGIDNRAALGQLFKVAFGVTPVYMTVPIGKTGEVKIEGFNPSVKEDEINEDEILKSVYGTPIIYPVSFEGGDYPIYDFYGKPKLKNYKQIWLPATTMVDFSRAKNVIKTNVLGANGTVKEIFGFDDWQIRIRMLCLNDNKYTARQYADILQDWFEIAGGINVRGSIFTKKEIYNIVIDDIDIKTLAGSPGVIPIEMSASSNVPEEIFINSGQ